MNINKMTKAELIQVTTLQKKDIKELTLKVEYLTTQVEKFRTTCVELTEANAAIIYERDTYKLALDRYLNNTPVKDNNVPKAKKADPKPEYTNAEQCQKDKDAEKNISNQHDQYATAKQVDEICRIFATQKLPYAQFPKYKKLDRKTAIQFIKYLKSIPVVHRENHTKILEIVEHNHVDYRTAKNMCTQMRGQQAYDLLVKKYGTLPTLTYAYKVEK